MSKSEANSDVTLALTPGEPAGIGPDLILSLNPSDFSSRLIVIADPEVINQRAEHLCCEAHINLVDHPDAARQGALNLISQSVSAPVKPGILNAENGGYVINCLEKAVSLCEAGICDAMVTGPVNKAAINDAGVAFSGHTEWLAERTETNKVVMLLATENLKVALVTTHLPLRMVPDAITKTEVSSTLAILHSELVHKFGIPEPHILVCGLNPHAGEAGYLGREDIDIIAPCLEAAREDGLRVTGPLPADTAFTQSNLEGADAVLAMYHDQGLPVLKHQGFGGAVNITLGLPIIRTSVDHGTALDIAGSGAADPGSLITAIKLAEVMSKNRTKAATESTTQSSIRPL